MFVIRGRLYAHPVFLSSRNVIHVLVKWPSRLILVGHFTGVNQITVSLIKLSLLEFLV